jgi:hypothetical protein
VEIYLGQVFSFVDSQFTAVFALGVDVLLLITLRYMIRRERQLARREITRKPPQPRPSTASTGLPLCGGGRRRRRKSCGAYKCEAPHVNELLGALRDASLPIPLLGFRH